MTQLRRNTQALEELSEALHRLSPNVAGQGRRAPGSVLTAPEIANITSGIENVDREVSDASGQFESLNAQIDRTVAGGTDLRGVLRSLPRAITPVGVTLGAATGAVAGYARLLQSAGQEQERLADAGIRINVDPVQLERDAALVLADSENYGQALANAEAYYSRVEELQRSIPIGRGISTDPDFLRDLSFLGLTSRQFADLDFEGFARFLRDVDFEGTTGARNRGALGRVLGNEQLATDLRQLASRPLADFEAQIAFAEERRLLDEQTRQDLQAFDDAVKGLTLTFGDLTDQVKVNLLPTLESVTDFLEAATPRIRDIPTPGPTDFTPTGLPGFVASAASSVFADEIKQFSDRVLALPGGLVDAIGTALTTNPFSVNVTQNITGQTDPQAIADEAAVLIGREVARAQR